MIALDQVSILKPGFFRREPIVTDASATFRRGERVGILASPGTGKSSLARLLAGIDQPDRGQIHREGRVSWPIGFAGFLHPALSVRDNLHIFERLVGMPTDAAVDFCAEFSGIPGLPRMMMQDLTPTQRAILAYACAVSVPGPAMWIADEVITVGEPFQRKRCDAILTQRLSDGGLVFLSRNVRQLKQYCDRFYVLINKRLVPCDDLNVAQDALDLQKTNQSELI
ncbi:ATP-binding cassette domain-containing protein [Antarctobacter sp.]|uniref:ATP-binding cassette domain-containing protein n=1 Tax=Antarctobacter sp. TaxID=1872577 RepID=UPI003A8D4B33